MAMKRVFIHWTAGTNSPNDTDRKHYHFMVDGEGQVHCGFFTPIANRKCYDGYYAAHTGGGNTGSIGIALCGMLGFKDKNNIGKYPLKKAQCEAAFKLVAELCKEYSIEISQKTVMTHKEFGDTNPKSSSYGKIDICCLPDYPEIEVDRIGDFIRNKIKWYYNHL